MTQAPLLPFHSDRSLIAVAAGPFEVIAEVVQEMLAQACGSAGVCLHPLEPVLFGLFERLLLIDGGLGDG
ncbi:MAG TPA: hypothetical protein VHX11_10475 [Acidobacteriaceae bacterium]|nr:hypothetical protein [Acidobacteriaceae bacterium]